MTPRIFLYRVVDKDGWPEMPSSIRTELYIDRDIAESRAEEMSHLDEVNGPWRVESFVEVRDGDTAIDLLLEVEE